MTLEFHVHDELIDELGLSPNAFFVFTRCGNWTARNKADGIVPADRPWEVDYTPDQISIDPPAAIDELVSAGLWTPLPYGGWRMERGPSEDWDDPMPLWRYSAPMDGVEIAPGLTIFPEPDE